MKSLIPFLIVVNASMAAPVQRFLPTSQVVQIAGIAARDEGFNPDS